MSEDPVKRLEHHNGRKVKFTKAFVPWVIVYIEEVGEREQAREREKYYKTV